MLLDECEFWEGYARLPKGHGFESRKHFAKEDKTAHNRLFSGPRIGGSFLHWTAFFYARLPKKIILILKCGWIIIIRWCLSVLSQLFGVDYLNLISQLNSMIILKCFQSFLLSQLKFTFISSTLHAFDYYRVNLFDHRICWSSINSTLFLTWIDLF